ncbi:MAG: protein-glutamate methylesterase/protein-glutamine glutaminase [Acidiferrobacteraceae bacterium]
MNQSRPIKVLVVDDSALMRQILSAALEQDPGIEVVGTAANGLIARERIKTLHPDVLTLDVEMPGMDGITFLERLMRLYPLPVVMVSSLTEKGAAVTVRALALGAVDFVAKPRGGVREGLPAIMQEIRIKVRAASGARVAARRSPGHAAGVVTATTCKRMERAVIAIGASMGGPQTITEILMSLQQDAPPVAIVQHMPPVFTRHFAERLDGQCAIAVREARDGDALHQGLALVAPGGAHMELLRRPGGYAVRVRDGTPVNRHCPSVDVLFESAARAAGPDALGIILTGMGDDGAKGLRAMERAGAHTIAQDEESCVVFGMPDHAIRLKGVHEILPLERIAGRMQQWGLTPASSHCLSPAHGQDGREP